MSINIGDLDIGVAFAGDTAGLQKSTADAQQNIDRFGASTSKAMRQVREDTQGAEDALNRLSNGFKGAVVGASVAVGLIKLKNTAIEVGDALIQAQVQLDKLNNGFKFGAGGAAGGARELSFVREEANRLGLELGGAAAQYMKMVAAARGTNMEGAKTRELFTSIAEASTVMGMSGEQSERAMMAIVQMMSKGKVQAEELRGQLGEHLPGAFAIAARAIGVTEVELNKLMETGNVMSADFLPKFAAQLRSELGGSVEDATKSMQASLNRFETAWLSFKQNVAQTGVSEALGGQINILSDAFNGVSERMEAARKAGGGFWSQTAAGAGGVAAFLNPINALSYSAISLQGQLEQAKTKLNELEKERPYSGNIFLGPAIEETRLLIAELERAKSARDQLSRQPGTGASEVRYSAMAEAEAVKAQQAKGLAYQKLMTDMATPQEKLTAAIFSAKKELGELYSPEVEARLREHFIKPTKQAKEKIDEFTKSAMRGLELYSDLNASEGGLSKDFSEKWVQLSDAYAKSYISAEHLLAAQSALLKQQPFYKKGIDDEEKALKEQAKAMAEAEKAYDAYFNAVQKNTDTLQGNIDSENEAAAAIGLSAIAIAELEAVKLQDMATSKERAALTWESIDLSGEMTAQLRAEAKALRDLAAAKVNRAVKETAADEAKQAADAWKKASEQIEKDITDALMRGFESGKGFAEVLRDTVANMFKTLVLRPVVQATVQGGLNAIGLGGGAGGAMGTVSNGISLYNAGSSALNWLGLGASAGTGLAATAGTGLSLASTGTGLGLSASAGGLGLTGTAASGASLSSGLAASTAAASGGSAMASIAAAAPWALAGLAVLSLVKSMDDSGTMHTGGLGSFSAAGGSAVGDAVKGQGLGFDLASADYQASTQQASVAMAQAVVGMLDSTAATFGQKAGYYAATAFADDSSRDGAWGALMLKLGDQVLLDWKQGTDKWPGREFADGKAGAEQYAAAVALDVRDYLLTQTTDWADAMLSALGDAPTLDQLGQVVQQLGAVNDAIEAMGRASQAFAGISEAATTALVRQLGGAEATVSNLGSYYTAYYTEAERSAIVTQQLTEQLAGMGLQLPATRDAWKTMVDAAISSGDGGTAASLIRLSGAFASVTQSTDELAASATAAAEAAHRVAEAKAQDAAKAVQEAQQAADSALAVANSAIEAANAKAKAFFDQFSSSIDDAASVIGGASQSIKSYLDGLNAQASGTVGLRNAQAAFGSQLALAKGGDREALSGITNYADRLLGAIASNARTASEAAIQQARVKAQLAALPGQVSAEELIVNAIERQTFNLAGNLTSNFTKLDANVDGLLTFEELQAAGLASDGKIGDVIAALDRNGDGQISVLEALAGTLAAKFDQLDTTLDGVISFDEFRTAFSGLASDTTLQSIFRELDVNGDGVISRIEASNVNTAATVSGIAAMTQSLGAKLAAGFGTIDVSGNGLVDYGEFSRAFAGMATDASLQAIFRELDVNGDGTITKLEAIRGSSGETASNTYGLDKLTRISDVINSLQWGTDEWNTASVRALSTVAQQQGWTADDMSKALGRFSGPEIAEFFAKYGGTVAVGGLNGGGASAPGTLNTGGSSGAGAFTAGGGGGVSIASGTAAKYSNSMGIGIYDPAAVDRLDSINGYVNSMNWGADAAASAWATYQSAQEFGVTQQELAVATGYSVADIQAMFDAAGVPRFAAGGMHSGGLRLVGENGPELEVTGPARYMNTAETMSLLRSGGANNTELLAEMRAMREDNQAQARAMVQLQQRIVKLQERWDANGLPSTRIEA